jgi:triosephosphate isomerase
VAHTKRRRIVAGNWKMFTGVEEGMALAAAIREQAQDLEAVDLVVCPPFTGLPAVGERLRGSGVALGAQDMHWEPEGPYTGEVSAKMLLTTGCRYVILGHSERRTHFSETNAIVNRKVKSALAAGLIPILCVGETLEEREAGQTRMVVSMQVREGLAGVLPADIDRVILAYEPVWAIGTGRVATPEQASTVHRHIRGVLAGIADADLAQRVRIQYGGSVKPENAGLLFAEADIDGALVGGASLDAAAFIAIAKAAGASS